jgi:hypothetical protein
MARAIAKPPVQMSGELTARIMFAGRSSSLSAQMVAQVRDDLFAKKLKPGDFLGTEKDLAGRFGTSRIVARDAMRTLEALGIVEIRMGKGGGARRALEGRPPTGTIYNLLFILIALYYLCFTIHFILFILYYAAAE